MVWLRITSLTLVPKAAATLKLAWRIVMAYAYKSRLIARSSHTSFKFRPNPGPCHWPVGTLKPLLVAFEVACAT